MNVLILTPDAVGSTLLQRLITIYMQFADFDRPVINLHELTNGIEKYFSPEFGCEIVSKRRVQSWGYYQSLEQVTELLASVDHYKTSRLAQYHIKRRRDPIHQQIPFYQYLDSNFFVIACRRHNVFEHALSMTINSITKKLNVYNHKEKINTFLDMYMNPVTVDPRAFVHQLDCYSDYLSWSTDHFNVSNFFYYDEHLPDIERYIMELPIWPAGKSRISWQEKFGISLNDWNRCHHIPSDLANFSSLQHFKNSVDPQHGPVSQDTIAFYQQNALPDWPAVNDIEDYKALPPAILDEIQQTLYFNSEHLAPTVPLQAREFFAKCSNGYKNAQLAIEKMQALDIIVSPPPIKKQTLMEKLMIITNTDQCLDLYNDWTQKNPGIATALSKQELDTQIENEKIYWQGFNHADAASSLAPPNGLLEHQSDDNL